MDIISKQEARLIGLKRYFTGAPCIRGHVEERLVSNGRCLGCAREIQRETYAADPERARGAAYLWREKNRERHLDNHRRNARTRYSANPQKFRDKQNEARARNAEAHRKYDKQYREDPVRGLAHLIRVLTAGAFKRRGYTKDTSTYRVLGCTFEFLKTHIERQFLHGMTWENRGLWQIDHIVPLASATCVEDVVSLGHFTNLRPMWRSDNIAKGSKVTHLL